MKYCGRQARWQKLMPPRRKATDPYRRPLAAIMGNSLALLEIAREDLNASNLLYNNGLYPQSIFYLQQSVEKIIKHIGLTDEIIEAKDLHKEIGHKTERIFKRLAQRTSPITGDTQESIDQDYQAIIDINKSTPIAELISAVKTTLDSYRNQEFPYELEDLINQVFSFIKENNQQKTEDIDLEELTNSRIQSFKEVWPKYHSSIMVLFILNSLLSDYVSKVRYPIGEAFERPSSVYNKDNELVKAMPYFLDCIDESIKAILKFQISQGLI